MANILYTNVRILDGSGEHPYLGEVLVQGNRIRKVARGSRSIPMNGNTVIDGAGATLMPGLCDAHTHLSWNNAPSLEALITLPPEE
jgi:imidazolonepropionase-like amidohydrolase